MDLHTDSLLLVPHGPQYLISTHNYAGDIENTKYMMHLPNKDINETKEFLEMVQEEWQKKEPEFYEFAVLLENEHIGAVGIYLDKDTSTGELGWIINKKHWSKGYATQAARVVMDYAVKELKVKRIMAHCDSENISSSKVMIKLGLEFVEITGGRKNRSSDEERKELTYSLDII